MTYNFRIPTRVADKIYFTPEEDMENVAFVFRREDGDMIYQTSPFKKVNKGVELWFAPERIGQCKSVIIEVVRFGKIIYTETISIF